MKLATFIVLLFITVVHGYSDQGKWEDKHFSENFLHFTKSVYNQSTVSVTFKCGNSENDFKVRWVLRYSPCLQEFTTFETEKKIHLLNGYLMETADEPPISTFGTYQYSHVEYMTDIQEIICSDSNAKHVLTTDTKLQIKKTLMKTEDGSSKSVKSSKDVEGEAVKHETTAASKSETGEAAAAPEEKKMNQPPKPQTGTDRQKREDPPNPENANPADKNANPADKNANPADKNANPADKNANPADKNVNPADSNANPANAHVADDANPATTEKPTSPKPTNPSVDRDEVLVKVWRSGCYLLILHLETDDVPVVKSIKKSVEVTVKIRGTIGYISAIDWPLVIFYGVMCLVYIVFGLVWFLLLACNWRDLMRLQYWIGAVIALGMLEKAVFYAEFQNIDSTGISLSDNAIIIAEVISSLKRALARMLVIIVSVGFGVVKPRLGPTFHKVLFAGGLYFIVATIEGCSRRLQQTGSQSTNQTVSLLVLAIVDASICWWIFTALVKTTRQLRLRRNIIKLSIYRHFTNTLIFSVIAAGGFMIWSVVTLKTKMCIKNWEDVWIDEAFWHLLFSTILAIIMILWRPTVNNQRYAFSPLIDAGDEDDEEDETPYNDAFDVKTRKKVANGSPKQKQNTIEDDLKWVEDNIPATLGDKASTLLESDDEEVMTVKYEMSKMQ